MKTTFDERELLPKVIPSNCAKIGFVCITAAA